MSIQFDRLNNKTTFFFCKRIYVLPYLIRIKVKRNERYRKTEREREKEKKIIKLTTCKHGFLLTVIGRSAVAEAKIWSKPGRKTVCAQRPKVPRSVPPSTPLVCTRVYILCECVCTHARMCVIKSHTLPLVHKLGMFMMWFFLRKTLFYDYRRAFCFLILVLSIFKIFTYDFRSQ